MAGGGRQRVCAWAAGEFFWRRPENRAPGTGTGGADEGSMISFADDQGVRKG